MEKQIILEESTKIGEERAKKLFEVLNIFNTTDLFWSCDFDLDESVNEIIDEIKKI